MTEQGSREKMQEAATRFRQDHDWATIPLKPGLKEPALPEGHPFLERRATEEEFALFKWGGVGIVTGRLSDLVVVDADNPEAVALLEEHGHPPTPIAQTQG